MTSYTHTDRETGAVITFRVDWEATAGNRLYPPSGPTVHGIEVTIDGALIDAEAEREILTRVSDADLIEVAEAEEMYRADDKGDHALELQREAS